MDQILKFREFLQLFGLRVTQSRLAVASVLVKNKSKPLSAEEIFHLILKSNKLKCDQVSVYRTLMTFEELGLVKKTTFQGEAARYKVVDTEQEQISKKKHHEHFFKCNKCKTIESLNKCFFSKIESELKKDGYRLLQHHLEITGLCPKCAE